jgi:membrane fusion protein
MPRQPGQFLFRPEVLAERRTQWLGTVVVAPRRSHGVFALFGLLAAAAIIALLVFAQYTRTVRVNGWLVPNAGVIKVFAPRAGVVTGLHVAEGAPIRKGEPLLTLSDELQSASYGGTQAEIARRMAERNDSLRQEQRKQEQRLAQQQNGLALRLAGLRAEETQIGREIELLKGRTALAARAEALHTRLRDRNFISDMRLQQAQSEAIDQRARLSTLERARLALSRERMAAEAELEDLPLRFAAEKAALERSIAQLAEEQAAAEAKREFVVPAPQSGTATAIHAVLGANAGTAALLSIVPADARLEAHLYSPSRAVGFLRPGQRVMLRYQPYPYQKFGHYEGTVASVSRSAVSPSEMPAELAGATGAAAEPMYRVTVTLERQSVAAYGKDMPLQAGMMLEADIALEKRRLYEWALDPLYTITGRQGQ